MTREEQAFEASKRFEESLTEKDLATLSKDNMCFAFQLGVKWAKTHPESPWISVKDDLPYNHKNLWRTNTTLNQCQQFLHGMEILQKSILKYAG